MAYARQVHRSADYTLGHCAKYLARTSAEPRHDYGGESAGNPRAAISECWRFPIVDSHVGSGDRDADYKLNDVTFVYPAPAAASPASTVELACSASGLNAAVPMLRIYGSRFWACTLAVPQGERHYYAYVVDGRRELDGVNPQRLRADGGAEWSAFFTWACTQPVSFERWELAILDRLCRHILPFNSREALNFLSRGASPSSTAHLYRLDTSLGVTNFIDNVVAREERHHLNTYKTCLELIDLVLRRRNPFVDPAIMEEAMYVDLYNDLAIMGRPGDGRHTAVRASLLAQGWDFARYDNPAYFLNVLRRHAVTGAFSHPKYGGNAGGMAWSYLEERYRAPAGDTLFDWGRAMEAPLGRNTEYVG